VFFPWINHIFILYEPILNKSISVPPIATLLEATIPLPSWRLEAHVKNLKLGASDSSFEKSQKNFSNETSPPGGVVMVQKY